MVATPITVYDREECAGHIVTIFQLVSSTGATKAETITLNAGYPAIDLTKAHPILSILWYNIEASDSSATEEESNADDEIARGTAPTASGDFDIEGYMSFKLYLTADVNGLVMVSYWAAGSKQV
ncbi:hypothetical protein LCGC14_0223600 [marine sediment metagenome]|uniref:Uncharacterized protein n=1 Tax=marine sediment metagenome TaxID=412755 RepID=A0A0F9UTI5_9ZZZZ